MSVQAAIVRRTLHEKLVTLLRDMIIEGELRPGSRIAETRLCTRFGVSRTPLREALKVLSAEGLVRLLPNKGASVVRVTHEEVEEALPILGALEALAGELACARIDKESLGRIRSAHRQMVEHFRRGEWRPYAELNRGFYKAIFEVANNKALSETYNMLQARLNSLLPSSSVAEARQQMRPTSQTAFQSSTGRAHWATAVEEHEHMLAALEGGDGAQFAKIARGQVHHRARLDLRPADYREPCQEFVAYDRLGGLDEWSKAPCRADALRLARAPDGDGLKPLHLRDGDDEDAVVHFHRRVSCAPLAGKDRHHECESTPEELQRYQYDRHIERLRSFPRHWLDEQDVADLRAAGCGVEDAPVPAARPPEPTTTVDPETASPQSVRPDHSNMAKSAPAPESPSVESALVRPRVRERAQALVREQLGHGPKRGELVKAAAVEADISERNLIAAAERLGVRSHRGQWWLPG